MLLLKENIYQNFQKNRDLLKHQRETEINDGVTQRVNATFIF